MFTIRNTVIVALMQIGVIVAGVLAAGLSHRFWASNGMAMPPLAAAMYDYGVLWFTIPIIWAMFALVLRNRDAISDNFKDLMFSIGILTLAALVVFVFYADVVPWLRGIYGLGGE